MLRDLIGLHYLHQIISGWLEINRPLITVLVERWKQDTHTFHLVIGETAILAVLLGVCAHSLPVIGYGEDNWEALVHGMLGILPQNHRFFPRSYKVPHYDWHGYMGISSRELIVEWYAQGYTVMVCGAMLSIDKSGDAVTISTSSSVRAAHHQDSIDGVDDIGIHMSGIWEKCPQVR